MAKENTAMLLGRIIERPLVRYNDEQDVYTKGTILIECYRMKEVTDNLRMQNSTGEWEKIIVFSKNHNLIKNQFMHLKVNQIVFIKGTFVTQDDHEKRFFHEECNSFTSVYGSDYYIDPIDILVVKTDKNEEEAHGFLRKHSERSMEVRVIGAVCKISEYNEIEENGQCKRNYTFTLASNRNRHILEDDVDKTTDYPIVKCYGDKAKKYHDSLDVGSQLYVYGRLQSRRDFERKVFCDNCGEVFETTDSSMELVPYRTIPIQDCIDIEPEMEENTVYLFGNITSLPQIRNNASNVKITMNTRQRWNMTKELEIAPPIKMEPIFLKPSLDRLKEKILKLEIGDLVLIKGTLATFTKKKNIHCDNCGYTTEDTTEIIYVDPIDIITCEEKASKQAIKKALEDHIEISNEIKATGTVITEPNLEEIENYNGKIVTVCRFQMEIKRNRFEEQTVARPYVCVYGGQAQECFDCVHIGSRIFVNGAIQFRSFHPTCEYCENQNENVNDFCMEISPYNIEYISGCDIPLSKREVYELEQ